MRFKIMKNILGLIGAVNLTFKEFLDRFSDNPKIFTTLNTDNERTLFFKYLNNSKIYFEFGSGGSTFYALKSPINKIYSVESSKSWYRKMLSWKYIRKNIKNKRLDYFYINIGKTGDWSNPTDESSKNLWPDYSNALTIINNPEKIDTLLVDGRFRVACILKSLLVCDKDLIIIVHDFWDRPHYHCVLEFLEPIDQVDSLGVFKPKNNLDKEKIDKLYQIYKFDYQ